MTLGVKTFYEKEPFTMEPKKLQLFSRIGSKNQL